MVNMEDRVEILQDMSDSGYGHLILRGVDDRADEVWLEYWDEPEEWGEPYFVYLIPLDSRDPMSDLDWVDWKAVGSTMDVTKAEMVKAAASADPKDRAFVYETVGRYYGWNELDHYPLQLSFKEMRERWPSMLEIPVEALAAVEEAADALANENFVQGHSMLDDTTALDLEDEGYDYRDAVVVATAGDAVGVNGDVQESEPSDAEMEAEGYEAIDRFSGAWPGGEEAEISREFVVSRAYAESGIAKDILELAVDEEMGAKPEVYRHSSDGYVMTWAKSLYRWAVVPYAVTDEQDFTTTNCAIVRVVGENQTDAETELMGAFGAGTSAEADVWGDIPEYFETRTEGADDGALMIGGTDDEDAIEGDYEPETQVILLVPRWDLAAWYASQELAEDAAHKFNPTILILVEDGVAEPLI